jgi:uncharacterized protein YkwD
MQLPQGALCRRGLGLLVLVAFLTLPACVQVEQAALPTASIALASPRPATPTPRMNPTLPAPTATQLALAKQPSATPEPALAPSDQLLSPRPEETIERDLVVAINQARASDGCAVELLVAPALTAAARRHSADMAQHGVIDHRGSDGSDRISRAAEAGYVGREHSRVRENLVAGMTDAAAIVALWMEGEDDPHRTQLLDCAYDQVGVGYARRDDDPNGHYITAMFGVAP